MYDVIVIGGGIAGLVAAKECKQNNLKVLVLEANDRVGGRTYTKEFSDGSYVDLGGMWISPQQERMLALTKELGIELMDQYDDGKTIMCFEDGTRSEYAGTIPKLSLLALLDLQFNGILPIERRVNLIDAENPFVHEKSTRYDSMTVEAWKQEHLYTKKAKESVDMACRMIFGCEPCELSFLYFLFYAKSNFGFMTLCDIKNGAQEKRMIGGAQQISNLLATIIKNSETGSHVILKAAVTQVRDHGASVTVNTATNEYTGKSVIVACPPPLLKKISFTPELPLNKRVLLERVFTPTYTKCIVSYNSIFWRQNGHSGTAYLTYLDSEIPITGIFDYTDSNLNFPALVVFITSTAGDNFSQLSSSEQETALIKGLVQFFGDAAAHPSRVIIQEWSKEPYSKGCPVSIFSAGMYKMYGPALRQPFGNIFWAGTETATIGCGYMEGAVQSGQRAASEVIGRLTNPQETMNAAAF